MLETVDSIVALVVLVIVAVASVHDRLRDDRDPVETELDELKELYANGLIDEQEHDRRLERVLDDRNRQIRTIVEDINGISDSRSKAIAVEYDSIEDLRQTDRERLESIPGIGEEYAEAVLEQI